MELSLNISEVVDYLDRLCEYLEDIGENNRELKIAREKLEEAVFWITYGMENLNEEVK